MKKLLALVLCIVMVLSLAPAAFAATDQDQPLPTSTATAKWASASVANKAISNAKKNIEYMYGGMAADTAVFGTIQAMDSIVVDLAKGMFEGIDEFDYIRDGRHWYISNNTLVDNTKAILRNAIGGEVADYMQKHAGSYIDGASTHWTIRDGNEWYDLNYVGIDGWGNPVYTDPTNGDIWGYQDSDKTWYKYTAGTGIDKAKELTAAGAAKDYNWAVGETADAQGNYVWFGTETDYRYDPIKYANTFATAVTKALSSSKGAANISAYMYALMQLKVADQIDDDLDDLWTDIRNWEDGSAILAAYGFAEAGLDPLALIDPYNLPKASMDVSAVIAPAARDYSLPVA